MKHLIFLVAVSVSLLGCSLFAPVRAPVANQAGVLEKPSAPPAKTAVLRATLSLPHRKARRGDTAVRLSLPLPSVSFPAHITLERKTRLDSSASILFFPEPRVDPAGKDLYQLPLHQVVYPSVATKPPKARPRVVAVPQLKPAPVAETKPAPKVSSNSCPSCYHIFDATTINSSPVLLTIRSFFRLAE